MSAEKWVKMRADMYVRHGGKTSRRATVRRLIAVLRDIQQHEQGISTPAVVGRAHIHRYYNRHGHLSESTKRDHYYAVKFLWRLLDRTGNPPKPR